MSRCTLSIAAHLVAVVDDGLFEAEYALFDAGDIELQATDPGTNREAGYRTTAGKARSRLAGHGITPALAEEAAAALAPIAGSYARGAAVRCIVDRIGPAELFEGQTYDSGTGLYRGAWLDLPALAADLGVTGAPPLLQALHLAAIVSERADDEPVVLSSAEVTALRRPGARTFKRVRFEGTRLLVPAFKALGPASPRPRTSSGPSREQVVERLRERADRAPASRELLPTLEAALSVREQPRQGPLADRELWALEVRLSLGDVHNCLEDLDSLERRRGRLPGTAYLRARAEFALNKEDPRELASRVSALSTSMPSFHELELLAAQAWAAGGDGRRAKAFARDLVENSTAPEPIRLQARLLLEHVDSHPASEMGAADLLRFSMPTIPQAPRAPVGLGEPAAPSGRPSSGRERATIVAASGRAPAPSVDSSARAAADSLRWPTRTDQGRKGSTRPAPASAPQTVEVERLEMLSLPPGVQGLSPPSADELPRTSPAARLTFTYLSRELGRDLRMRHGVELRTDVDGLELAQRYLRERLSEGRVRTREDERDLLRYGAFLSELLARRLGAHWADLDATEPGRWVMLVPAVQPSEPDALGPREAARTWPFARVLRFVSMGHKERDLVSYYLELETRSRHP